MVLVAFSVGRVNTLAAFVAPFLAEIGMMTEAGSMFSLLVENVAESVVLKGPVYVSSIKFPRSKMMV